MLKSTRNDALIVYILLVFAFGYFYQDSKSNGRSRLGLVYAIVQEGRLTIDDYYNQKGTSTFDKAFYDGHYYSDKAIGPALVATVFYVPIYWMQRTIHRPSSQATIQEILTFLVIGLPAAIAGTLMYILCFYWSKSRFRSYLTTLAVTLGTMYFPFGVIFFSHVYTASLLFIAFFLIFFLKEKPGRRHSGYFFLIGSLLGWALIGEFTSGIIIFGLSIYYLSIIWKNQAYRNWRSIVWPALGGLIPIVLQLVNNRLSFGSFFSTGYANSAVPYFREAMSQGIAGISWPDLRALYLMTIHPDMGLFWQSPVLLLAFVGAVFWIREKRFRAEAILAGCVIITYLVVLSGYYMWWGGASFAPRHLLPMLPFFCLFLIFVPKRLNGLFVVLTLISFGQMLIVAAGSPLGSEAMNQKITTLGFFEFSNIYDFSLKQLLNGGFTRNIGNWLLHLDSWASLVPFLVVVAALTLLFFLKTNRSIPLASVASSKES